MGNLTSKFKIVAGVSVISAVAIVAALPATANAWKVNHGAESMCKDNTGAVSWVFKNTEPNHTKWSMDVEITDAQTGGKIIKTVKSGDSVSGTFTSSKTKLSSGKVYFKMFWTDGRSGIDTRSSSYKATAECKPFVEPAFDANVICTVVDEKGIFTLNVRQTKGDGDMTFAPSNGTKMPNGDPVTVVGVYQKDGVTLKKTVKTQSASDCTPEVEEEKIKVCRDGVVVEIYESEKRDSDTSLPCPIPEIEVCRDGKVITIAEDDRKVTDTDAPCEEVKGVVTELPNTGAGSIATILGSTFAIGTAFSQIKLRRNTRR